MPDAEEAAPVDLLNEQSTLPDLEERDEDLPLDERGTVALTH